MRALPLKSAIWFWLTLAVLLSYANSLTGDFQFDDYNVIVNEPQVHGWTAWFAGLGHGIRPLLKLSYTLNWTINATTLSFHLGNLLIHLSNTFLVYRLSQIFVQQRGQPFQFTPLIGALLFAVHPIHTEAVSYISGRSISLMTFFYLAALLSYAIGRAQQNKIYLLIATPLLFLLALATKETAVTLPFALLLWELSQGGDWRASLKRQWPSWVILLASTLFFLLNENYFSQMQRSAELNSLQGNIATQLEGFTYLIRQWALPLWLNIDPDLALQHNFADSLLPLIIFVGLSVITWHCRRKRPWISFALAWAMLHLLPLYLLLPRIDVANERQMYLASWPLFLALGIELRLWLSKRVLQLAVTALLLTLVGLTVLRNQIYRNEITLWEDTVKNSPHKARVHNNLGYAYLLAQRPAEARREFMLTLQLDPANYQARYNLYRLDEATD
jgi:hypothetical protein